ncbi:hypothetical protein [Nonomuraea lactucae]|uniref:hypothetical protein n=1 Tax=Nonomuraea lactucae TaxID=2249762 RepID=UPI000DE1F773|nr:hypothetical protein [Nonomuraea lactucae]
MLPAVAALPAQAAAGTRTTADGHQLKSATGHCLVPRGRDVIVLPCKEGYWLWREVVVPSKDEHTIDARLLVYGDGKTVDPVGGGTWCLDTDQISKTYMSKCDRNRADKGQLWYTVPDGNVNGYYHWNVFTMAGNKCRQLAHYGNRTGMADCKPIWEKNHSPVNEQWRFGQQKGDYKW